MAIRKWPLLYDWNKMSARAYCTMYKGVATSPPAPSTNWDIWPLLRVIVQSTHFLKEKYLNAAFFRIEYSHIKCYFYKSPVQVFLYRLSFTSKSNTLHCFDMFIYLFYWMISFKFRPSFFNENNKKSLSVHLYPTTSIVEVLYLRQLSEASGVNCRREDNTILVGR